MSRTIKTMLIGLILSICIIVLYMISYDWPEWFEGASIFFDFFERLAEAYVASFIFFCILIYIPYLNKKKYAENSFDIILCRILFNSRELLSFLKYHIGIEHKEIEKHDSKDITEDLKFNLELPSLGMAYIGSQMTIFQDIDKAIICNKIIDCIDSNIKRIEYNFEYYDDELVDIITRIKYCDIFESIRNSKNDIILKKMIDTRIKEIRTFNEWYIMLLNYMKTHGFPTSEVALQKKYKNNRK